MSELESRHRKELKALEGEKRAAVKKVKATKAKKAKSAIASIEEEYASKLADLQTKHKDELALTHETATEEEGRTAEATAATAQASREETDEPEKDPATLLRERKQAKARRKREKQRQEQLEREAEQERDLNDPNTARRLELEVLSSRLEPLQLEISEVTSDGHCLYRAVAAQMNQGDFTAIRNLCADTLEQREGDLAPFCEFEEGVASYAEYVDRVRNSADWGGHVELMALSVALQRAIVVYSAQQLEPLVVGNEYQDMEPIRLSYHLHYYALGEHYNQVVTKGGDAA